MKKRILSALLVSALVMSVTACGGTAIAATATTAASTTETPATTTAASTTEAPATTTAADSIEESTDTTTVSDTVENDETSEESGSEFKEFNIYDVDFTLDDFPEIDFLNEEQKQAFMLASFVYMTFDMDGDMFFRYNDITPVYNEENYMCHTGFDYESVVSGFKAVLSEDILNERFKEQYTDLNGEFLCFDGARGASADFDCIKGVTPVEITDDKVSFQLTAAYADPETKESLGETAFDFEMLLTDGHWVMTKYELWI